MVGQAPPYSLARLRREMRMLANEFFFPQIVYTLFIRKARTRFTYPLRRAQHGELAFSFCLLLMGLAMPSGRTNKRMNP